MTTSLAQSPAALAKKERRVHAAIQQRMPRKKIRSWYHVTDDEIDAVAAKHCLEVHE